MPDNPTTIDAAVDAAADALDKWMRDQGSRCAFGFGNSDRRSIAIAMLKAASLAESGFIRECDRTDADLETCPGDLFGYVETKHCGTIRVQHSERGPHIVLVTHCDPESKDVTKDTRFLALSWKEAGKLIRELVEGMAWSVHDLSYRIDA